MQTELSAGLYITDPTQTYYAVFNNPADPDFVGYITDITGFDSPDVRENAQNINAGDGGYHGAFYHGRRPWTVSGMIVPSTPAVARSAAQTKIDRVMNACTKQDGFLVYTPSDNIARYLTFRKQQPQRITSGQTPVQKDFQIAGVCRDWRFLTAGTPNQSTFYSATTGPGEFFGTNVQGGDALAPVLLRLIGPAVAPVAYNDTIGLLISFPALTITSGDAAMVDLTGQYPQAYMGATGDEYAGTDVYGYIDETTSDLDIGMVQRDFTNTWQMSAEGMESGVTSLQVNWNDAWN